MNKLFLGALLALSTLSCNDSKRKELELKEKELELKEKELNLEILKLKKIDSVSVTDVKRLKNDAVSAEQQSLQVSDPSVSNINNLLGYWVDSENENIFMYFDRNGSFSFTDLNSSTEQYEELHGTYTLKNGKLTLFYNDRAQQTFNFFKENLRTPIYLIQKGRYLMQKAVVKE